MDALIGAVRSFAEASALYSRNPVTVGVFSCFVAFYVLRVWTNNLLAAKKTRSASASGSRQVPIVKGVLPYGVYALQGHRQYMEDRYVVAATTNGAQRTSLYGVFDGHGGYRAAEFCVSHLFKFLTQDPKYVTHPGKALRSAFLATDDEFLRAANAGSFEDGTTAIVVMVRGDDMWIANVGDSRAILVQRQEEAEQRPVTARAAKSIRAIALSEDHKPNRPDERKRVQRAGGFVLHNGVWRVQGVLAVSRALGDRVYKDYVIAVPDIVHRKRDGRDHCIVMASDGVWDVMSNDEVASLVKDASDPSEAARIVSNEAFLQGSRDNICSLVINLQSRLDE